MFFLLLPIELCFYATHFFVLETKLATDQHTKSLCCFGDVKVFSLHMHTNGLRGFTEAQVTRDLSVIPPSSDSCLILRLSLSLETRLGTNSEPPPKRYGTRRSAETGW